MEMFSKELEILDRNTVKLMIDEMGEELVAEKKRADTEKHRADTAEKEVERLKKELERMKKNE